MVVSEYVRLPKRGISCLQETPIPGAYRTRGFVDDLHHSRKTYGFRDGSRAKSASHQRFERTGQFLLPGEYRTTDSIQSLGKKKMTYGFKAIQRDEGPKIGHGYGDKVGGGIPSPLRGLSCCVYEVGE